ncbi:S8 family serine peptidase [Ohtaekwangia kribbensis]|uniref:S8 family serine peptidase n=1 Tax=Ohtaekwangia kribbensis TaxID=688913 RepID=A0ABW3K766_9BACT
MRVLLGCLLAVIGITSAQAQHTATTKFTLPKNITRNDYHAGKVMVKVKKEYISLFSSDNTSQASGRKASIAGSLKVSSLAPKGNVKSATARAQAFKPVIDITQYFEISFDPSQPVEDYINTLYASGYIELAEPAYKERMLYTPNDPAVTNQYYLTKIRALEAWNVTKGDENIVIAIIDSGVDIDHPDLVSKLYINQEEANGTAGVDDDNNGFIDDINGWDFSGADTLNALDPNYKGDNNPAIFKSGSGFTHGTQVGGCAGAAADNGIGLAGVGFNTKLLFTKHYADNQRTSDRNYSSDLYLGVLYAARNGARIINCSWGGAAPSQVYQDLITHVTKDLGCLVVAAAGNSNLITPLYPASYDNVLSVAATDQNDIRGSFSNYGPTVDLCAPGVSIYTTVYNNGYGSPGGTSFSSPITAAAAALVWSQHPEYTAEQVAEQLRVSADASIYAKNPGYINYLGKGRLDVMQALTLESPSIRASNYRLLNEDGLEAAPGENARLIFDFTNYLKTSSSGLEISISSTSAHITITKDKINPGAIAGGATINNTLTPFELTLSPGVPANTKVDILLTYTDGAYQDYQVLSLIPNPTYMSIDDNRITTTISSSGRLAYEDTQNSEMGNGFVYNGKSFVFELGLIMGNSSSTILNTVRNGSGGYDQDFTGLTRIKEIMPGERSFAEVFGNFSNSTVPEEQKVKVSYRTLVWQDEPYDKFVIVEYKIKNTQASALSDFYFGMFADWDVSMNGVYDAAQWDAATRLGYVYQKASTELPQAGIQLLTGSENYYAIDNHPSIAGASSFGLYDGFTDAEKYTAISSTRSQAGTGGSGNDVSHVVSAGPFNINAGDEVTVAFALHAADNFNDLVTSAKYADSVYNYTLKAPLPLVDTLETCYGSNTVVKATGATKYHWYKDFTGGEPIGEGSQITISGIKRDTTLYVANASKSYESLRVPAHVMVHAQPTITASRSTTLCSGDSVILSVETASEYAWSSGEITQSIKVGKAGNYSVMMKYEDEVLNCVSTSNEVTVNVLPRPEALFSITLTSGDFIVGDSVEFTNISSDAKDIFWDFGDGATSIKLNPKHAYDSSSIYEVSLTVTAENGCQDIYVKEVSVVTSVEETLSRFVKVYPVPTVQNEVTVFIDGLKAKDIQLSVITTEGLHLYDQQFKNIDEEFSHTIGTSNYAAGIYFLAARIDGRLVMKKFSVSK